MPTTLSGIMSMTKCRPETKGFGYASRFEQNTDACDVRLFFFFFLARAIKITSVRCQCHKALFLDQWRRGENKLGRLSTLYLQSLDPKF